LERAATTAVLPNTTACSPNKITFSTAAVRGRKCSAHKRTARRKGSFLPYRERKRQAFVLVLVLPWTCPQIDFGMQPLRPTFFPPFSEEEEGFTSLPLNGSAGLQMLFFIQEAYGFSSLRMTIWFLAYSIFMGPLSDEASTLPWRWTRACVELS